VAVSRLLAVIEWCGKKRCVTKGCRYSASLAAVRSIHWFRRCALSPVFYWSYLVILVHLLVLYTKLNKHKFSAITIQQPPPACMPSHTPPVATCIMSITGHHSLCFLSVNGADRGEVKVVDQVTNFKLSISVHAYPDLSVKWEIQNDSLRHYYTTEAGMIQQTVQLLHSLTGVYNLQIHMWHLCYFEQFCNTNTLALQLNACTDLQITRI
jgi:hypothetical protein